ncbi:hypothetical protein [Rhizobium sp. Leaf383]|uniref:hypothetical protein n=1 Tax=Rhizobium sp. Leaf383 TaxID=1736357 RepID=UPI000B3346F2|nr:hypothetical protein [Rhizobium sp. Leaf383]
MAKLLVITVATFLRVTPIPRLIRRRSCSFGSYRRFSGPGEGRRAGFVSAERRHRQRAAIVGFEQTSSG